MLCPTKTISEDITFELLIIKNGSIYITCLTKNILVLSTVTHKVSVCNKIMDAYVCLPMLHNQHKSVVSHRKNENGVSGFWLGIKYTSCHQRIKIHQERRYQNI